LLICNWSSPGRTLRRSDLLASAGATFLLLTYASVASAIGLNFSNEPGSFIQFGPGNALTFEDETKGNLNDIRITASTGDGSGVGLTGDIDGAFTVGAVTVAGLQKSATLSGIGMLSIFDGVNSTLTGDVSFGSISTFFNFGAFNISSAVNLTNLSYSGANADLQALANDLTGVVQASFTAASSTSLSRLVGTGTQVGNYTGTIVGTPSAPVPEPSAALSFALGSLIVGQVIRRRK
jgi:hypothetical protein